VKGNSFAARGAGFQTSKQAAKAPSTMTRPHFHVDGCKEPDCPTSQIIIRRKRMYRRSAATCAAGQITVVRYSYEQREYDQVVSTVAIYDCCPEGTGEGTRGQGV
jgi:hypothetical protein